MISIGQQRIHDVPGVMAVSRPHVAPVAGPGVHLDFGEARTRCRGSWPVPIAAGWQAMPTDRDAALVGLHQVAERDLSSWDRPSTEITPSRNLQLRGIHLERFRCAFEQLLAQLVRGVVQSARLAVASSGRCSSPAIPATRSVSPQISRM